MRRDVNRGLLAAIGTAAVAVMPAGPISAGGGKGSGGGPGIGRGPNSNTDPYLLPVAPGVRITSLLTVSDGGAASNGYGLVGIPDGLGAMSGVGDIDFTLYGNHECSTLRFHKANPDPTLVEYGQLLAMKVKNFKNVYTIR